MQIKRNILLNPGPATTTDTVKMAQVVPDICPREKEFASMMKQLRADLVKVAHGIPEKHTAVLFCGSGTINIDVCLNSLLPANKKVLIINNINICYFPMQSFYLPTQNANTEFNQLVFSVLQNSPEEQKFIRGTDRGLLFCKETNKICKNALFLELLAYLHFVA